MGLCPYHVFHPTAAQCSVPLCTLDYSSCDRSFQVCVLPPTARRLSAAGRGPALPGPAVGAPVQQRAGAAVPVGWPLLLQPRPDSLGGGTAPAPEQATDFGVGQCLRNTSNKSHTLRACVLLDTSSCCSSCLKLVSAQLYMDVLAWDPPSSAYRGTVTIGGVRHQSQVGCGTPSDLNCALMGCTASPHLPASNPGMQPDSVLMPGSNE